MENRIKANIQVYLNQPSNYALMLSGEWGTGKTYYLTTELYSLFRENSFRPVYISLMGMKSLQELQKQILEKSNPIYLHKISRKTKIDYEIEILSDITKKKDNNECVIRDRIIPQNVVLCFDDLERIEATFFLEALGYIHFFTEYEKIKTIYLANEIELKKNLSSANITVNPYNKIKEKYINSTYQVHISIEDILDFELEKPERKNLKQVYGNSLSERLISSFNKANCKNIRIWIYTISTLNKFSDVIIQQHFYQDKLIIEKEYIFRNLFYNILVFSLEIKKGTDVEELKNILSSPTFRISQMKESPEKSSLLKDIQEYIPKDFLFHFSFIEEVYSFYRSGIINFVLLKNDLDKSFDSYKNSATNNELRKRIDLYEDIATNPWNAKDITQTQQVLQNAIDSILREELPLPTVLYLITQIVILDAYGFENWKQLILNNNEFILQLEDAIQAPIHRENRLWSTKDIYIYQQYIPRWFDEMKSPIQRKAKDFLFAFYDCVLGIFNSTYIYHAGEDFIVGITSHILNEKKEPDTTSSLLAFADRVKNGESNIFRYKKENAHEIFECISSENIDLKRFDHFIEGLRERWKDKASDSDVMLNGYRDEIDFGSDLYDKLEKYKTPYNDFRVILFENLKEVLNQLKKYTSN